MKSLRIMSVVGARPNFMKIAPLVRAVNSHNAGPASPRIEHCLVHSGQHYDRSMSEDFFTALQIPEPDVNLEIGSGTHAEQVGRTMIAFERVVREKQPDWVVVVGDVNATCACSITAKKERVRLAHIEAGLRSFDLGMPEEINRMVTDRLADLLLTPDAISDRNLRNEGVAEARIECVGNIMIDTLDANIGRARALDLAGIVERQRIGGGSTGDRAPVDDGFAVLTMHRPSNVDDKAVLEGLAGFMLERVAAEMPLIWSLHPRTGKQLARFGLRDRVTAAEGVVLIRPVGYHEMLRLNMGARVMLTDSGGLQEECCVLGTPCITLRENTERPVTLWEQGGLSKLVGHDPAALASAFAEMRSEPRRPFRPPLWDGHTAERIVAALVQTG